MPAGGMFHGDPLTGNGTVTYADGTSAPMTYMEYTGGLFYVQNGQIVDFYNRFNRTSIGQQGDFTSEYIQGIGYNVISQTLRGTVNRPITSDTVRLASGDIVVNTRTGEIMSYHFEGVNLAAAGYQWAVYTRYDGSTGMTRVPAKYLSNAELQADYTAAYRLATPEEVVFNAAAYQVVADPSFWNDVALLEQGLGDLNPEDFDDYEIAGLLFQAGSIENLQVFQQTIIQ